MEPPSPFWLPTFMGILLCRMLDYRESKTTLEQSRIDQYNIILLRVLLYRLIHSHKGINFETQSAGITTDNILANAFICMYLFFGEKF